MPIENFLLQYNREYDFFEKLSNIVATQLEEALNEGAIMCIVSKRAKNPKKLKEKLDKRHAEKAYRNDRDIYADIVDLSGVRVALYFPCDRVFVDKIIEKLFTIQKKVEFPKNRHSPCHEKRFSGYWATHYRVALKETKGVERFKDLITEIQVASVLMHAWSEVEHDLAYKPLSGELSSEEYALLDQINGLVMAGEIALERLKDAKQRRVQEKDIIHNQYELGNIVRNEKGKELEDSEEIGDVSTLYQYLKNIEGGTSVSLKQYNDLVKRLRGKIHKPFFEDYAFYKFPQPTHVDSLLLTILDKYPSKKLVSKNISFHNPSASNLDYFDGFIDCWAILESALSSFSSYRGALSNEFFKEKNIAPPSESEVMCLSEKEWGALSELGSVRNKIVHGKFNLESRVLFDYYATLRSITEKVVESITDKDTKKTLLNRLMALPEIVK